MKLSTILIPTIMVIGLSGGCDKSDRYIKGVVLNEVWAPSQEDQNCNCYPYNYPYGFSIKTSGGEIKSYDVMRDDAISVDAKIQEGDSVAIDLGGVCGETLTSCRNIDVVYREGVIPSANH